KKVGHVYRSTLSLFRGSSPQIRLWARYREPVLCRLHLPPRQKRGHQVDHLCQCQRGLADLGRETEAVGCSCWRDPHWHGIHLPLRGKSLSGVGAARVRAASLPSRTNPSFSATARVTSQDGPTRCHDHCPSIVEWGGTNGLCAGRASGDLSKTGALAYATRGYSSTA